MLFDLQGKRRRLIQATYLLLAILLGGGLVLFGVGSDVQGGLADIFTGGDGGESGNPAAEQQLEDAQATLRTNPDDPEALADVVRGNFQLATATDDAAREQGRLFAADATPRLEAAADAWQRYLEQIDEPDPALGSLVLQVYSEQGLNRPAEAAEAAQIVAEQQESAQAYLLLSQYAGLAGDERRSALAGERAVALAPKAQRKEVERQVDAIEEAVQAVRKQAQGGQQGTAPGGPPQGGLPLPGPGGGLPGGDQPPAGGQ
jgi:hypothetical protein